MLWFSKMAAAWALSMVAFPLAAVFIGRAMGHADSGLREAILSLGILLWLPSILFALLIGWPVMSAVAGLRPQWLLPLIAGAVLSLVMFVLSAAMMPDNWRGATYALAGYGATLGLIWGSILALTPRAVA